MKLRGASDMRVKVCRSYWPNKKKVFHSLCETESWIGLLLICFVLHVAESLSEPIKSRFEYFYVQRICTLTPVMLYLPRTWSVSFAAI